VQSVTAATVIGCSVCGEALEFEPTDLFTLCPLCRRVPPRFDFAISYAGYDGALRSLLHLLKYDRLRPAADVLGHKLARVISAKRFDGDLPVLVVPVPLHRAKRRQRRFNQSELIAQAGLKRLPASRFELHCSNLCRVRATESQTGLTRHQRRENVRGAFKVSHPEQMRERTVLIVDDVYTTGTTLNECAPVIRAAGAKQVVVATVARVYRPVAELIVSSASKQEEHASAFAGAVAG
jgi:ComF family protein